MRERPHLRTASGGRFAARCAKCARSSVLVTATDAAGAWEALTRIGWTLHTSDEAIGFAVCPDCNTNPQGSMTLDELRTWVVGRLREPASFRNLIRQDMTARAALRRALDVIEAAKAREQDPTPETSAGLSQALAAFERALTGADEAP